MVFVVALFFLKNKTEFKNPFNSAQNKQEGGLTYNTEILGNLVNRDTDLDGVLDWEEGLWGTDPTKKDTNNDGVLDNVEIEKLKAEVEASRGESLEDFGEQDEENLTETDKFSREFFATIATLSQNGQMDEATIEQLSSSLAERIKNSAPRKVFLLSDIKIINNENTQVINSYNDSLGKILMQYPKNSTVLDVLQKFIVDENNVDVGALAEFDPIITQTNKIIAGLIKMSVPRSFASAHLDFTNALERLVENLSDIQLYEADVIISLGAISQYEQNADSLQLAISNLSNTINKKLSN